MCMVTDPGADIPVLRESGPTSESGRGLNVVESCSVRWGWHLLDEGGKVVWALLRPASDPRAPVRAARAAGRGRAGSPAAAAGTWSSDSGTAKLSALPSR